MNNHGKSSDAQTIMPKKNSSKLAARICRVRRHLQPEPSASKFVREQGPSGIDVLPTHDLTEDQKLQLYRDG